MQTSLIGATPSIEQLDNSPSQELGREDFLRMLISQLENQDPLDPQDASEFTAQLATFSSLDQLINMRTAIDELAATQSSAQNLSVASLVGRNVLAESKTIDVGPHTSPALALDLQAPGDVHLRLIDSTGRIAGQRQLSDLPAGRTEIELSSFESSIEPGRYTILAEDPATGAEVTSLVRSTVTGASFESGTPTLLLGSVEVPLASLIELHQE